MGRRQLQKYVLPAKEYHRLFETAVEEFGQNIIAYYNDIPFEETLRRHSTKPNRNDFGEADMRRWWREKGYLSMISERRSGKDLGLEEVVEIIYGQVTA